MNNITINFTEDEAVVLLEWLSNFNQRQHPELFEDQSEQRVLWDLECELERILVAQFKSNYLQILLDARARVRDDI